MTLDSIDAIQVFKFKQHPENWRKLEDVDVPHAGDVFVVEKLGLLSYRKVGDVLYVGSTFYAGCTVKVLRGGHQDKGSYYREYNSGITPYTWPEA